MDMTIAASGHRAMELGSRLGRLGVVTIGADGEELAWVLARCAGCGAALAGSNVLFHDGTSPAVGDWLARHYRLPAALYFTERDGGCAVHLVDGEGCPIGEDDLPPATDWAGETGTWDRLAGTDGAYAANIAGDRRAEGLTVTVMAGLHQSPLRQTLERMGCTVLDRPLPGVPLLRAEDAGGSLLVREGTAALRPQGRDAADAAAAWCAARAAAMPLAVPAFGEERPGQV